MHVCIFRSCLSKINNTFVDNVEYLDIVMLMYNLWEYRDKFFMISGSLWNYYEDEINDDANENVNHRTKNNKTITSKYSKCKPKLIERTPADNNTLDVEVIVPLKYLSELNIIAYFYLFTLKLMKHFTTLLNWFLVNMQVSTYILFSNTRFVSTDS